MIFDELGESLSEEDIQKVADDIANAVVKRGVVAPAIMFLEMNKPLSFIASQGLIITMPFLAPFIGADKTGRYSRFFKDSENVERLIQRIEELAEEQDRKKNEKSEPESENTEKEPKSEG